MSVAIIPPDAGSGSMPRSAAATEGTGLVHIVSGSFGAGHDAAAAEIARRLQRRGYATRTWDVVELMPHGLGRALRAAYLRQVHSLPATWSWTLRSLERHAAVAGAVAWAVGGVASPALLDLAADNADVIVSTHPFASQMLGRLRGTGRITTPVVTYLTDMSVHPMWVHPAVDLHLAVHELPSAEARLRGARRTCVVRPAVREAPLRSTGSSSPLVHRRALGLPLDERLALVTGGSCGVGRLETAAAEISATGLAVPVVLCGRNERLRRRVSARGRAIALGWTDDMYSVLDAVDVVVQNSGGYTSLETLAAGVPVLTYRSISGHGETNARALDDAGLVPWVRSPAELADGLRCALSSGRRPPPNGWLAGEDVVDAILPRVPVVP